MAEITIPDILADAVVTGPNILPLDPSAAPVIPPEATVAETEAPEDGTPAPAPDEPPAEPEPPAEEGDELAEDDEPAPSAKPTGRDRLNVRFSELTQQRDLARQEADYWKSRALAQGPEAAQPPPRPPQDDIARTPEGRPLRPQEAQYATQDEFVAALERYEDTLIHWSVDQRLALEQQQRRERESFNRAREAHEDFEQVWDERVCKLTVSPALLAAANASDRAYELKYKLALLPLAELQSYNRMDAPAAFLAMGRLEATLDAPSANDTSPPAPVPEPRPQVSQAPPPIAPTRAVGGRAPRSYDEMSLEEFFAARNKEEQARRR